MRITIFAAVTLLALGSASPSNAVGCFSGGAAGAVAGHYAGHHGVIGAVSGCIAGHEWHKHQLRQQDLQSPDAYDARRKQYDPNYQNPWN